MQGCYRVENTMDLQHFYLVATLLTGCKHLVTTGLYNTWTLDQTGPWTGLWTGPWIHSSSDSDQSISLLYHCLADLHSCLIQDVPHLNNIYDKRLMKSFNGAYVDDVQDRFYLAGQQAMNRESTMVICRQLIFVESIIFF